jgi:hypothetical protein
VPDDGRSLIHEWIIAAISVHGSGPSPANQLGPAVGEPGTDPWLDQALMRRLAISPSIWRSAST